jgi:HSP20 family protein
MATRFPTPVAQDLAAVRRLFDPFFTEAFVPARGRTNHSVTALPLDVFAHDDEVIVVAAVPGIDPEAIAITVEKNTVTITGKTTPSSTDGSKTTWFIQELPRGDFSRALTLPFEVDAAQADATFENGLLRLTLPKRESAKARQIRVKVAGAPEALPARVETPASDRAESVDAPLAE